MKSEIRGKKYFVREIPAKSISPLIKKLHYSGKCVSNSKLHLGIFDCEYNMLVGGLQYGPPMNGIKTSKKISDTHNNMMELNRMVIKDSEPRNSESQAISLCNKWLRANTDLDYILSFSDGKENNCGYIYQATNWIYIGYRVSDSFYDLDGNIVHSVTIWHRYKEKHPDRDIKTTHQILFDNFENISIIKSKQHIYLFPLKKNVNFNFSNKSYPKLETEVPILERKWLKKNGEILNIEFIEKFSNEKLESVI